MTGTTATSADTGATGAAATSVSTHILDTSVGRPAEGVTVHLSVRASAGEIWSPHGTSSTDGDGRCKDLPALPEGTTHVRLHFDVEPYFTRKANQANAQQDAPRARDSGAFFPEVAIVFAVRPGEHFHVPLLLNPFGYSVYRGS
ncbi:hydroxyisourate hydrolase [Actinacidiphila alni]|uniref:hydroxyisourate hydrolase n=1 Tax=Actinacidiphila alni TaxID=380248 RepID=UPI00345664E5